MVSLGRRICQHICLSSFLPKGSSSIRICLLALSTCLQGQEPAAHLSISERTLPLTAGEPYGLAVDHNGNLYIADEQGGTAAHYNGVDYSFADSTIEADLSVQP
jgi:hypothetical protein